MISASPQIPSFAQGFARRGESVNPNLWRGLVGAWAPPLGPTGLTLFDQSGYRNDGTLTSMDSAANWVMTEKGWALDFNGSNNYVAIPNIEDAIYAANAATLILLARPDSTAVDQRAFGCFYATINYRQIYMWMDAGGAGPSWAAGIAGGTGGNIGIDAVGVSTTEFQLVAVTWDGTMLSIYVNGELRDSGNFAGQVAAGAAGYRLGALQDLAYFDGMIAMALAYNRALIPAEIMQLHLGPAALLRPKRRIALLQDGLPAVSDRVGRGVLTGGRM